MDCKKNYFGGVKNYFILKFIACFLLLLLKYSEHFAFGYQYLFQGCTKVAFFSKPCMF